MSVKPFALGTYAGDGSPFGALVAGERLLPLADIPGLSATDLPGLLSAWDHNLPLLAQAAAEASGNWLALSAVRPQLPYRPGQVFCTGANYRKHVIGLLMGEGAMRPPGDEGLSDAERLAKAERMMDERARSAVPYIFVKLPACAVGPEAPVVLPRIVQKPDWELELGVVIGRRAWQVSAADAMSCVAGYMVVNDVTARDHIFRRDGSGIGSDWLSGKCFPGFLPMGPHLVPRQFVPDPYNLNIRLAVNDKVYQDESTADMMIPIERQIEFLAQRVVLEPGDILCTGSPYGNGAAFGISLRPGDVMEGGITGLGRQRNVCVAET